jgi:class 3 adenylate cyclase/tetratricopeptide (TPR) repeat protein
MQCASCHTENPDGYKFCSECGAPLKRVCGVCAFANEARGKFCGGCGAALGTEVSETEQKSKPKQTEAERRQLTVMFCDLVGSTALSERLDPEDLRDAITTYQDMAAKAIERYSGYIARYMGDGLLIYFGYPNAHERDPERAVRAGLDIIAAMAGRTASDGTAMEVRIGAATGMVVAGDIIGTGASEEAAVLGDTPNLAARLQGLAKPGTMVISENTRELCGTALSASSLGDHSLKGIANPVTAYVVKTIGNHRSVHLSSARGTPLFGRDEAIDQFSSLWKQALAGHGGALLITGEPGFGKSRLLTAYRELANKGGASEIFVSGSEFYQDSPLRPFREYLIEKLNCPEITDGEVSWAALERYMHQLDLNPSNVAPALGHLLKLPLSDEYPMGSLDAAALKEKINAALLSITAAEAGQSPLLLVIEDAQWIDASSIDILKRLMQDGSRRNQLAVFASRPGLDMSIFKDQALTHIDLKRLDKSAATALINWIAGESPLSQVQLDNVLEHADGVPLFLEEITKSVIDVHRDLDAGTPLSIPSTLQDSLMGRLDRLGSAKVVAQTAAVIGRVFRRVILSAIANNEIRDLDSALLDLVAADLIAPTPSGPSGSFEFKQALIRDAAYQSLLIRTRRDLHQSIAAELESQLDNALVNEPEIVAYHLSEAGLDERALPYWIEAAKLAAERWANVEAINFYQKALVAHRKTNPDGTLGEIDILLGMVASMRIVDRFDDAFTALGEAEALCPDDAPEENLIRVHYLRGNMYFPLGNTDECLSEHSKARALAQNLHMPDYEARALSGIGDAYFLKGEIAQAETHYDQAVEICRSQTLPAIETANLFMRGHMRLYLNRFDEALEDSRDATEMAVESGNRRAEMTSLGSVQAKVLAEKGDWAATEQAAQRALTIAEDLGALRYKPMYQSMLARAHFAAGHLDNARHFASDALAGARRDGMIYTGAMVLGAAAKVCDDRQQAEIYLDEGLDILNKDVPSHNHLWFSLDAMDCALVWQDWTRARLHADVLETFVAGKGIVWADFHIERCRLLCNAGDGSATDDDYARLKTLADEAEDRGQLPAARSIRAVSS